MPGTDFRAAAQLHTEEVRMRNYENQLKNRHEENVRDLRDRHEDDVGRMLGHYAEQKEGLVAAYEVKISEEAERLEDQLSQMRIKHDERVQAEKQNQDVELQNIKTAHQKRVEEYKKNNEIVVDKMRRQLQAQSDHLHAQARKTEKKEKGGTG